MTRLTRKGFFKKTSTGALAVGALGVMPGMAAVAAGRPETRHADAWAAETEAADPFVVYVRDPRAGEVVLMVGDTEITTHDPALVRRLWQIRRSTSHHPAQSSAR